MWSTNYDEVSFRICSHAVRLAHPVFFQQLQSLHLTEELLDDLVHLCNLFRLSDRHEEAKQLATRLLSWCQQTLGPDDLLTLTICNLLGLAAMALRDFITAEEMLRRAMEGLGVVLGEHHQITLDPVHNLANLYVQLGCHGEAERLYLWSLRGCEQSYGWDNLNTFWAAYAIGDFYYETGNLGQAESMYERALKGFDNAIDPDHWFPRKTAISLGHVYSLNKKPDHARLMYQRAPDGCERQLGRTHPDTAKILGNLVDLCVKCNDLKTIQQLSEHWGKDCLYLKTIFRSMALKNSNEAAVSELLATEQGLDESSRLRCNSCSISISRITRRFVCMNCADTNLCGNCYSKHQSGKTSAATCANHFFVEYSFLDEPPSRLLIGVGVEMTTTGFH